MTAVPQARIAAESAKERLLKRILRALASEQANEMREDCIAVVLVEPLEGRNAHGLHHAHQRAGTAGCEMRTAVIGHVEWVEFARVARVPRTGDIVHAAKTWSEAAGGGAVAALELLRLSGDVVFFTALGDDEVGHRAEEQLRMRGVRVEAVYRNVTQRRAFTFVDDAGERTITTIGSRLDPRASDALPWDALAEIDAAYFTAGDPGALRNARRAKALVATARVLPTLAAAGVELDAVVRSGSDESELYEAGDLDPPPRLVAITEGRRGGRFVAGDREGRWAIAPLPGPIADSYGAGDSFAAGLAFALGERRSPEDALAVAARSAARAMTVPGTGLIPATL
jgi:ribokinase